MIHAQKLNLEFWAEVVNMVVYIKNRCPTKILDSKAPQKTWIEKHMHMFLMKKEAN
jgi:hypothetical protein